MYTLSLLRQFTAITTLLAAVTLLGCGGTPQPAPPPGPALSSAAMDLALADVPDPFIAAPATDEARWVLEPEGKEGELTIELGPAGEVNLVAAVQEHQAAAQSLEGGEYLGAGELAGALGAAFWSRLRRPLAAGTLEEETKLFVLHPEGDPMVVITYTYPAGDDSSERVQEALAVLGEVEGLTTTTEQAE